jgi:hypothetical protein
VAAAFDDGTQYKSPSGSFAARPLDELQNWSGAVGYWKSTDFVAPRTLANARTRGRYEPFALAIPDFNFALF